MTDARRLARLALVCALAACGRPAVSAGDPAREIGAMLERQAAAWNRGDLDGFMADYARDSLLSYVSGARVLYGWQALRDRYHETYFAAGRARDSLAFETLRVRPLTPDVALATARFALWRGDSVVASGPFTLVLRQEGGRWLILHDHTSSDPRR